MRRLMALLPTDVSYTLLEIFVLLAFAELLRSSARRYGLPQIVGEVLAGMVLSAYALGGILNGLTGIPLFQINNYVVLFADFSIILLIFAAGLEGGFSAIRGSGIWALGASIVGDLLPFGLVYLALAPFYPTTTALLVGVAAASTSTAVVANLIRHEGRSGTTDGKMLLTTAALDDVVGLVLLSIVLTSSGGTFNPIAISGGFVRAAIAWAVLLFSSLVVIPWVLKRVGPRTARDLPFVILFAVVAVVASLGFSVIIGAFLAGLALSESMIATRTKQLAETLLAIFGSLFFVVVGAQVDVRLLVVAPVLILTGVLVAIASLGKFVAIYPFALKKLGSPLGATHVAGGMIPRGEIGLVVASIGLSTGLLDSHLFGAIVLMSISTTVIGGLVYRWTSHRMAASVESPAEVDWTLAQTPGPHP